MQEKGNGYGDAAELHAMGIRESSRGGVLLGPLLSAMQRAWAASKKILAKGTKRESLIQENPAALDTTNLEITPLEEFGTMGPTDKVVDLATPSPPPR